MKFRYLILLAFLLFVPLVSADIIGPGLGSSPERTELIIILIPLLLINFVINLAIIYSLLHSFNRFKKPNNIKKIYRIILITIIGLIIDYLALVVASFTTNFVISTIILGALVFVVAGTASYLLVFVKVLKSKQAIISSVIFGIISNPVWLYIFLG